MTIDARPALRQLMTSSIQAARMRGISVAIADTLGSADLLHAGTDADGAPLADDSLFPVASVSKLATALAVLRIVDSGAVSLDDPIARHVPEAVGGGHWGVTIRRLLSHTSGLPLDLTSAAAPYAPGLSWPALAEACVETPLAAAPNTRVQYSNVGYGLLAIAVERETGQSFPTALEHLVFRPLGIEGYLGVEPPRAPVRLSGIRGPHANTDLEPFNSPFWRSLGLPWAGLITTATGALTLVRAFAGHHHGFLRPSLLAEATSNQNGDLEGGFVRPLVWKRCPWGLGPEIRDDKAPHWAPPTAGAGSFGHSGASGCISWFDPAASIAWAILGTRVADSGWLVRRGPELGTAILNPS
ncbi:MAG TPA: serine hydrolase domain-containing protein [Chloroflexota bacterium]